MIKTPRIDSLQSIKDPKNNSVIVIRRSQLDVNIYKLLLKKKLIPALPNDLSNLSIDKNLDAAKENLLDKNKVSPWIANLRWVISFCDCMMQISKFFCMDSAQALQTYFQSGSLNLSGTEYNLFYSIFAYLFFLPFFAGMNDLNLSFL